MEIIEEEREGCRTTWQEREELVKEALQKFGDAGTLIDFNPGLPRQACVEFDNTIGEATRHAIDEIGVREQREVFYLGSQEFNGTVQVSNPVRIFSPLSRHSHLVRLELETEDQPVTDELHTIDPAIISRVVIEPTREEEARSVLEISSIDYAVGSLLIKQWYLFQDRKLGSKVYAVGNHLSMVNIVRRVFEGVNPTEFSRPEQLLLKNMCQKFWPISK